jgi:hypothetical protein
VGRLLEVDQELRERLGPGIAVELADPAGALVLGEHQDVEEHGARRGTDGLKTIAELAFDVLEIHANGDSSPSGDGHAQNDAASKPVTRETCPFVR